MTDTEALVFVVDDDASLRASLQDLLESVGLRVAACASAQDFLRRPRPEGPSCQFFAHTTHPHTPMKERGKAFLKRGCERMKG